MTTLVPLRGGVMPILPLVIPVLHDYSGTECATIRREGSISP